MTFFKPEKLRRRKIEIDRAVVCSDSPEVRQRLERIRENYQQLDVILAELETKIQSDERLKAIDAAHVDVTPQDGGKKKRKWRPGKSRPRPKSVAPKSANPRKPR